MNLEKSHMFISENYEKLFEEQKRLEIMHQRQLDYLKTNTEQLSATLKSSHFVNEKLTGLNDTMMKTQESIQALSNETKREKQTIIDLQKDFYGNLATKREEELNKLGEAIDQNTRMILQMEEDMQTNRDTYKTLIKELQSQHLENQQTLSDQMLAERESMHREQKEILDTLSRRSMEDQQALKRLTETIAADRKTELDQWTKVNETLHTELPAKIADSMEQSGKLVNESFRETAEKFTAVAQDLNKTAQFVSEQEKAIQKQWDTAQSNLLELTDRLVRDFAAELDVQLQSIAESLRENIQSAELNTARAMTDAQRKIASEQHDFLIREAQKIQPSVETLTEVLSRFQKSILPQMNKIAETGESVNQSFQTGVSHIENSFQQTRDNQEKFEKLIKQNILILKTVKTLTDALEEKIAQIKMSEKPRSSPSTFTPYDTPTHSRVTSERRHGSDRERQEAPGRTKKEEKSPVGDMREKQEETKVRKETADRPGPEETKRPRIRWPFRRRNR
jgi:hypothetical protein